ncbi:MAG: hypothetical protein K0S51_1130 [Bacillales bacterium]|jgi:hypothetical protein|nr:hypothetical protein [Bacillales bacterium]
MKKYIISFISLSIIVIGIFTYYQKDRVKILNISNKVKLSDIKTVSAFADSVKTYNTVSELKLNSDTIFEGKILDIEYFDFKTNTFSKLKIRVTKNFTSNIKKGDVISVVEAGGITTKGNIQKYVSDKFNIPVKLSSDLVAVTFNGIPLSKVGEKVILFAGEDKEDFYNLNEKVYYPIGSNQGKFIIDEQSNKVFRHIEFTENDNLKMSLAELINKIENN